jgi:arginine/serine-rich splicing factor 1/9
VAFFHSCQYFFCRYGKIREIDLKTPSRPPAFAFISYDDYRDAQDAVRGRDGYNFDGYRLRVEFSKGDRGGDRGGGRGGAAEPRRGGGRRTEWGVVVSNLPRGCSWQDLKDFMRKVGDVVFTDVERNGDGVVDFSNREDMEEAIRRLDDTEFKSYTDSSYIRVRAAKQKRDRSEDEPKRESRRDRSPSPRGRSVSRSRSRDRSANRRRDSEDNVKSAEPRQEEAETTEARED